MHPPGRFSFAASPHAAATTLLFLVVLLPANAQKPSGPPSNAPAQSQNAPSKKITVITNENLNQATLRQAERTADAPSPAPVSEIRPTTPAASEATAAQIATLQKQIKEKQRRIELLMHLFVADEKKFVQSSGALELDPDVQKRIRQEQDELRRETAVCAQLQAHLDALRGSGSAEH